MSDCRRAALTLHALPQADRLWVMDRLEPALQRRLSAYLDELQQLGIPRDSGLIEEALANAGEAASDLRTSVSALDGVRVGEALHREPAALVARVLAAGPWPWEKEMLQRLSTGQRDRITEQSRHLQSGQELDEWLLQRLLDRCGPAAEPDAARHTGPVTLSRAKVEAA